jgi:hypothetical protein
MPAPELPTLPQIADIPEYPDTSRSIRPADAYIDPDMLTTKSEKTIVDLFPPSQEVDHLN